MQAQIPLGSVLGIRIGLHYSWFVIASLITLSLAHRFEGTHPEWGGGLVWLLAIGTSLLFFATLLVHELSHALLAVSRGVPVRSVVLFALGGVAQIEREATDASTEFWIGIVGPLVSAAIGVLCLGSARLLGWIPDSEAATPLQAVLVWLGYINAMLAVFNLIPGFPLDGGRVLRGILWGATGDPARATRAASFMGQLVGFAMIAWGCLVILLGGGFGGLWLVFIGWFLLESARETSARMLLRELLRDVRVEQVMHSVAGVGTVRVEDAVAAEEPLVDAIERLGEQPAIPVVRSGEIVGVLDRDDVLAYVRNRKDTPFRSQV